MSVSPLPWFGSYVHEVAAGALPCFEVEMAFPRPRFCTGGGGEGKQS